MAFDRDPESFVAAYAADEQNLRARIARAQTLLPSIRLGDKQLATIARVCGAFEVDGMRADIVTARAAAAHAAWHGRSEITKLDIRAAARLALPHRRRRNPFDAPGLDEDFLDQLLDAEPDPDPTPPEGNPPTDSSSSSANGDMPTEHGNGSSTNSERSDWQPEPVEALSGEPSTRSEQMPDRPSQIVPPATATGPGCSPHQESASGKRAAAAALSPRLGAPSVRSQPVAPADGYTSQPPSARLRHGS